MVTGGSLKPAKCHASVEMFKFVNGKAKIKKKSALLQVAIKVPQKRAPTS